MVRDIVRREICERTGMARLRVEWHWLFGWRLVAEEERQVEYRSMPIGPPLRLDRQWFKVKPRNLLGRHFYGFTDESFR